MTDLTKSLLAWGVAAAVLLTVIGWAAKAYNGVIDERDEARRQAGIYAASVKALEVQARILKAGGEIAGKVLTGWSGNAQRIDDEHTKAAQATTEAQETDKDFAAWGDADLPYAVMCGGMFGAAGNSRICSGSPAAGAHSAPGRSDAGDEGAGVDGNKKH